MMFVPLKEIKWIEQLAHFLLGMILVMATTCQFGVYAVVFSMSLAVVRELSQRYSKYGNVKLGKGSRTDLAFWLTGSLLGLINLLS